MKTTPRTEGAIDCNAPWSAPVTLARIADHPQPHGAFMTPAFVKDGGKTVHFVMSQFGPYNTFVMKASLER
ncbi:MAG TPA: hypothetical protein VHN99_10430 [Deinococcales bacterium]|nr:hypothetical protein [Deinococcales bacterium]